MEFKDILLIVIGFIAGFINTVAGGGSVLILPVLILFIGLPPSIANGTNRVGILIQTIFSAWGYKSKNISPFVFGIKKSLILALISLCGATMGAYFSLQIPDALFNKILSIVMIVILALIIFKPKSSSLPINNSKKAYFFTLILFFIIGIYAGIIQAGTGLLLILTLSYFNKLSLIKSNALKTLIVFVFTIGTISIFAYNKQINWYYGFLLAIGNALGGWIASRWSVTKGDQFIQVFMIVSVIIMAIKLWY